MRLEYLDEFRFITEIIVDILNDSTEIIVSVGEFKIKVRYNLIYTNSFINMCWENYIKPAYRKFWEEEAKNVRD